MTTDTQAKPATGPLATIHSAAPGRLASLARSLRGTIRLLALVAHVLSGCVIAGTSMLRWLLGRRSLVPYPRGVRWWMARCCRVLHVKVRAVGEPATRSGLVVANHVSWLDIPVLGGLAHIVFLSKAEIRSWPVIGWMAAGGGTIFIPRGAHQAGAVAGEIASRLAEGASNVLVFPEGTTTNGSYLRPFYPRLFACLQAPELSRTAVTVQPVAIRYLHPGGVHPVAPFIDDESFPSHLRRVLAEREIEVEVRFCPPFDTAGLDRKSVAQEARRAILAALQIE